MNTEISAAAFAHNLRYLRKQNRKTQAEVSQTLDLDRSTYAYYEIGRTHPRLKTVVQIAWLYQLRVNDLFSNQLPLMDGMDGTFSPENLQNVPELNLPFHLMTWRLYRNLRQWQIAEHLGIDRSTYAYYESGKSEPTHATLVRLAEFYDIRIDQLMGFVPEL